jgi:antitoxin ParD1/3/4
MSTEPLNISLPPSLKNYLEDQVKEGGYETPSEYLSELVREDQKRKAEAKLEALLLEGVNSGEPIEANREYWERKSTQLIERHNDKAAGNQ